MPWLILCCPVELYKIGHYAWNEKWGQSSFKLKTQTPDVLKYDEWNHGSPLDICASGGQKVKLLNFGQFVCLEASALQSESDVINIAVTIFPTMMSYSLEWSTALGPASPGALMWWS